MGTGSGILAIFAAKAGAKKVYAVEATNMAKNARKMVEHNKVWSKSACGLGAWGVVLCVAARALRAGLVRDTEGGCQEAGAGSWCP